MSDFAAFVLYVIVCGAITFSAYHLTSWAVVIVFGKRLRLSYTDSEGVTKSTTIRYRKGEDIDRILSEVKAQS